MTDQQLIAQLLGAHKRIASITASKHTNALEAIADAKQIAAAAIAAAEARDVGLPDGWVFCTADFSLQAAGKSKTGSVMLIRDHDGRAAWHKLSEEEQEIVPLYMSGVGETVQEAIADAAKRALLAKGDV